MIATIALPAAAQTTQLETDNLRAQQEAAQRRAVDLDNQLMAAEARQRADSAVRELELRQRLPVRVPTPDGLRTQTTLEATPIMPQIPENLLADSNRKVREAADERR